MKFLISMLKNIFFEFLQAYKNSKKVVILFNFVPIINKNHYKMLKNKKTYYQLILDKSGCMIACLNFTVSSL